jgi:hypothetical protein
VRRREGAVGRSVNGLAGRKVSLAVRRRQGCAGQGRIDWPRRAGMNAKCKLQNAKCKLVGHPRQCEPGKAIKAAFRHTCQGKYFRSVLFHGSARPPKEGILVAQLHLILQARRETPKHQNPPRPSARDFFLDRLCGWRRRQRRLAGVSLTCGVRNSKCRVRVGR